MKGKIITFGDDVDTDQIIPSQYLLMTIDNMKSHAFETILPQFPQIAKKNSIIVAGDNFGCGSSREQAPAVLKALGIKLIVARSFARIFYRNAINIGLPVLICENLYGNIQNGDTVNVDMEKGRIATIDSTSYCCTTIPQHMTKILNVGGLIAYLNERTEADIWQ